MIAVVTGASKGIGYAISETLAEKGYNLILCSRNKNEITETAKSLSAKYNVKADGYEVDMASKKEVEAFAKTINSIGAIDVLINNAGIFLPGETSKEEDGNLEMMIETNLYSAYHLTRALLSKMIKRKSGYVFNMCSIASKIAYPNGGSYSISKFALLGFTKVLREEMKPHGIKVTAIMPGATWSHSWEGVDLPQSRLMQAKDIAKLVGNALDLSDSAVIEEIVIRPQLGDL